MSTWAGADAEDVEHELGLDESAIHPRAASVEPSIDHPPKWGPALAFGVWPPISGPDGRYLRAVTVIDDRTVIATKHDRMPCAAVAETTYGHNRWYHWVLDQPNY